MSKPRWPTCGRNGSPVTVVVDASAIVEIALDGDTPRRRAVLDVLRADPVWVVPEYTDIEVISAVGRGVARGSARGGLRSAEARDVLRLVAAMPFTRMDVCMVADRILELIDNHSASDAGYIAVAERVGARVLTLDRGMAASPVARCKFVQLG